MDTENIIEALLNERNKTQDPERIAQIDKKLDELSYTDNATSAGNNGTEESMSAWGSELTNVQEAFTSAYLDAFEGKGDTHGNMGKALLVAYEATVHFNRPKEVRLAMCIIGRMAKKDIYTLPDPNYKAVLTQLDKDIAAASEEAKAERTKSILQNAMSSITEQAASIKNTLTNPASIETLTSAKESIKLLQSTLDNAVNDIAQETIKRVRTSAELFERMRNQPQGYKSGVFGITFPVDTLSFIGARMSRGKTAALTSIAIDALFPLIDKNGKRKDEQHNVLFITREETDGQIARRLILCKAWRDAEGKTYGNDNMQDLLLNVLNPYWGKGDSEQDKHDPKQCYNAWIKGILKPDTPSEDLFIKAIQVAAKEVSQTIDSGRLAIFDGAGASTLEERAYLNKITEKTVVLYDYIQLAPADGGIAADAYAKKAAITDADKAIINAMKTHRGIAIAGAQFNRTGTQQGKDIDPKRDEFSESAFADCGNLENDAHIAIGIGWEKDDTGVASKRFWKLLKNREGGGVGSTQKELDARGIGYSYLKSTGKVAYSKSNKGKNDEANYIKTIKAGKGIIEVTD